MIPGSKCEVRTKHDLGRKRYDDGAGVDRCDDELESALTELKTALRRVGISEWHHIPVVEEPAKTLEGHLQRKNPNLCTPRPRKNVTPVEESVPTTTFSPMH
jgi:hypothetical protein